MLLDPEFAPAEFGYGRFLPAITLGTLGGWLFVRLSVPLPWILRSMTVCTIAAAARAPIKSPAVVRPPMIAGVVLGAAFTSQVIGSITN